MREILFRGLHRRKGEKVRMDGTPVESMWVYGGYCQYNEERGIIYQTEPNICKYPVYADSVGQYTGLTDKNGNKIFEGDIFKISGKRVKNYVFWYDEDERGFVYGSVYKKGYRLYLAKYCISIKESEIEIIGNIHDNPELIGGDVNDHY